MNASASSCWTIIVVWWLLLLVLWTESVAGQAMTNKFVGRIGEPFVFDFPKNTTAADHVLSIVHLNGNIIYARNLLTRENVKNQVTFTNRTLRIDSLQPELVGHYTLLYLSPSSTPIELKTALFAMDDDPENSTILNQDSIYESRSVLNRTIRDSRHKIPSCRFSILTTANASDKDLEDLVRLRWELDGELIAQSESIISYENQTAGKLVLESRLHKHWNRSDHNKKLVCSLIGARNQQTIASANCDIKLKYGPELMLGEDDVAVIRNYSGQPMLLKCGVVGFPEPLITWTRTEDDTDASSMRIIGTGRYYKFRRSTPGMFNISCRGSTNGQNYQQKFTIHLTTNVRALAENSVGLRRAASIVAGSLIGAFMVLVCLTVLLCVHRRNRCNSVCNYYVNRNNLGHKLFRNRRFNYSPPNHHHKTLIANSASVIGLNGHVDFVDPENSVIEFPNGILSNTAQRTDFQRPNGISRSTVVRVEPSVQRDPRLHPVISIAYPDSLSESMPSIHHQPSPPPYSSLCNLHNPTSSDNKFRSYSRTSFDYRDAPKSRLPLRLPSISATDHATMLGICRITNENGDGTYIEEKPTNV